MALVNMDEMLIRAKEEKYAVGAFDLINMEFAEAILAGAAKLNAPVILSTAAVHFDYVNMESLAPSLVKLAQDAPIPVALHLDHGSSLEMAVQAIRLGYTSVQVDTAHLPFEENVKVTKEIVKIAHSVNVSVEGELGYVSGHEGDHGESRFDQDEPIYTDPADALRFVEETGIDCLAVSIGTVHGLFKGEPRIDLDRMQTINNKVSVPLVIHGGSGLSEETYKKLIECGMAKINFYAELSKAAVQSIQNNLNRNPETTNITQVLAGIRPSVQERVESRIKVWGSDNKYSFI
ncbi:class II fructose-bisphosphate aldolase [Paenibacillus spongiae]|uniref:Class II fructose-bisphosphate aldolase family protein n=1 Tax=Paenibacillus spongiae TaxID=2909671 RepID=A0ABY5SDW4_9BACL|nr:class II fructose-bisphosphate aldolase [Paenibacillus spongiae]UVI30957.1 class II fructose-bisphosphate aldolase family protein [Paenibacillus spongiae]